MGDYLHNRNSTTVTRTRNCNLFKHTRVVPWRDPEEFLSVYEKLYSDSLIDKQFAVDQITVWESRCVFMPSAIEATVVIVGASIQDMLFECNKTNYRERDIINLLSMALVRFINLIVQQEGPREKLSVLAEQQGIPTWIVDLRHEASHAQSPKLAQLRIGITYALRYLKKEFWKQEKSNICQIVKTPSDLDAEVFDVISKYKSLQFISPEQGSTQNVNKEYLIISKIIHRLIVNNKEGFVDALVKPGVFLSAKDIEQSLSSSQEYLFLESITDLDLPQTLVDFWVFVIRELHHSFLISYFLEKLLLSLEDCTSLLCKRTGVAWVMYILSETSPHAAESALSSLFKIVGVQLNLKRLLYASLRAGNPFTVEVFAAIAGKMKGPEIYSELAAIVAVREGIEPKKEANEKIKQPKVKSEIQENDIVFVSKDLEHDVVEEKAKRLKTMKQKNVFSLAPEDMDWANLPLGGNAGAVIPASIEDNDEVGMEECIKEEFIIIEENDKEPTVEVERTPDMEIFQDPEIGDMIYSR